MKTVFWLIVLHLVLVVNAFSAPQLRKMKEPVPATMAGYVRAHCVPVSKQIDICKAMTEMADAFVIRNGTQVIGTWPATVSLADTSVFEVLMGDLDGNGDDEVIVANHDRTSNGLGVSYWTISILDQDSLTNFRPPLSFSVEEYGHRGTFVSRGGAFHIFTTKWVSGPDPAGSRAPGLYLTGRLWRYESGKLAPIKNSKPLARRFLNSFARDRASESKNFANPYRWFQHRTVESRATELLIEKKIKDSSDGVIRSVKLVSRETGRAVELEVVRSDDTVVRLNYPWLSDDLPINRTRLDYLGDISTQALFPENYLVSDPVRWLEGRRCKLTLYEREDPSESMRVLWLW